MAAAGRTDRSVVSLAFLSLREATKVRLAEPSGGRARTLKLAEDSRYARIMRFFAECMKLPAFDAAQPAKQPDAEP